MQKKKLLLKAVPFILLLLVAVTIYWMFSSQPQGRKRPNFDKPIVVEVVELQPRNYNVVIQSYGTIEAATSGNLISQASGLVISVADNFASGLSFKKGQELLSLDDRDYRIEVTIARAELANAQLTLQQEQALADQAKRDWNKINPNKTAPALVIRKPQVASAKAKLEAASARLEKAKLALSRTRVKAPYDGQIIKKLADIGQLVNPNTPIATIFSMNSLEVRLPVPANKIQFLPQLTNKDEQSKIRLKADFGGLNKVWEASLDRTDSVIDSTTRQWFVTAKLDSKLLETEQLLKIGQFVNAEIKGKKLQEVFVIDNKWISQNNEVFLYQDGTLVRKKLQIIWRTDSEVIIANNPENGLQSGEQLITTPLNFVADGAKVTLKGSKPRKNKKRNTQKGNAQ